MSLKRCGEVTEAENIVMEDKTTLVEIKTEGEFSVETVYKKEGGEKYKFVMRYRKNDVLHREDGPAYVKWYKPREWFDEQENFYREHENKLLEIWYYNGEKHRDNGPAVCGWYEPFLSNTIPQKSYEIWYQHGKKHRDGGEPAEMHWDEQGRIEYEVYYQHGERVQTYSQNINSTPHKTINQHNKAK